MSRRFSTVLLPAAGLLLLLLAPGAAALAASARATIEEVMDQALVVLRDDSLSKAQRQSRIEEIAAERFDFDRISKLVLARNWKKLSEKQRADFVVEFKRHLSLSYGRRLSSFTDEVVEVGDVQNHSNGDVTVKTTIEGSNSSGLTMDYRMRERDGEWLAIDVVIEGVSMIANFRAQVQEIVSSKGAGGLIEALREKNERDSRKEPGSV